MNHDQLKAQFPNASESFLRANSEAGDLPQPAQHKPDSGNDSVGEAPRKVADPVRRLVRITSYRLRELDERNLWDKYVVDALRYAGVIFDDSPQWCQVEVHQIKVGKKSSERTEVEIYEHNDRCRT
jgi:hypothetical protein